MAEPSPVELAAQAHVKHYIGGLVFTEALLRAENEELKRRLAEALHEAQRLRDLHADRI